MNRESRITFVIRECVRESWEHGTRNTEHETQILDKAVRGHDSTASQKLAVKSRTTNHES